MPFCTSCGKEVPSGKKFCEYCGTPLEQSAAASAAPVTPPAGSPAPALPPVVPVKPAGGSGKTTIIAGIIVVVLIIAGVYFIGLPMINGSQGTGPTLQHATAIPTQVPTVQPATFLTATIPEPASTSIPAGSETYEEKYTQTYHEVFSVNQPFVGGQRQLFSQDLTSPPLYIKFNITPTMEAGEKIDEIGHTVSTLYISPNSWFKVRVYDAGTGALIEEQGFNKGFSVTTQQEFMVRAPGTYRVEISGNGVTAEVHILTG